jgi:hypothetical protein
LWKAARENEINFVAEMFLWLVNRHENENPGEVCGKVSFLLFQSREREKNS